MAHTPNTRLFVTAAVAVLGVAMASQAQARQAAAPAADSDHIEEIVVTAQKREQKLQDVPVAVSAFGTQQLEAQSVQTLTDLSSRSPSVVLAPVGAYPYASAFYIRGLGFADVESTFEPAVGVEMNGIYLARNSGALQDFFDIDSVEILRGPQGTLYGRNTIGGVVAVHTKAPVPGDPLSGAVQATMGDHGRKEARFALNIPVSDSFAVRGSFLYKDYDGYNHNATLNRTEGYNETISGRVTAVFKPNDMFDATVVLDGDKENGSGASFRNASLPGNVFYNFSPDTGTSTPLVGAGTSNPKDPYTVYGNTPTYANINTYGVAATMNFHTSFGTITSVTGYRMFNDHVLSDYDASSFNYFYAQRDQTHHQLSQEIRLANNSGTKFDYVVGVYAMDQSYHITNLQGGTIFGGGSSPQIASQKNTAYALFGQGDYHVTDQFTVTFGGRYSYEKKNFTNQPLFNPVATSFSDNWKNFSPKIGLNYKFSDAVMVYASWSKGFRSGGYNGRAAATNEVGPYDAETVSAYEAGVKSEVFDRRLRLNGAVFSNTYSNMQIGTQDCVSGVCHPTVTNAGKARIDGVEGEALWVVGGGLRINANASYLHARFLENFTDLTSDGVKNPTDNSDLPLAYAPKWSGSIGATYTRETPIGDLTVNANAVYIDDIYTSGGLLNRTSNIQVRPANTLYDATISLEGRNGWKVSLWGKNLADKAVINNTFSLGGLGNLRVYAPPRTWGLELGYKF